MLSRQATFIRSLSLAKSVGLLALALVAVAVLTILTQPTLRVSASDPLRGLDKFEADCVITINTFPFTGTCKGDHIGAGATIVDTPGGGTALGTDSSNVPCILQTSSETLTTHDGSTITLK